LIRFDDFIRELRENPLYTTNIEYMTFPLSGG